MGQLRLTRKGAVGAQPTGAEAGEANARIKVAVTCDGTTPLAPEQGLEVYIDDASEPASPVALKKRFDAVLGHGVVDYVSYAAKPGAHSVRLAAAGCASNALAVDAQIARPTMVTGNLEARESFTARSPAGSPDGWRIGVSAARYSMDHYFLVRILPAGNLGLYWSGDNLWGGLVDGGLYTRWWVVTGEVGIASGAVTAQATQANGVPYAGSGTFTMYGGAIKTGPRLPLSVLSLSAGLSLGLRARKIEDDAARRLEAGVTVGAWGRVEANVLCDWVPFFGFDFESAYEQATDGPLQEAYKRFQLGVSYQPSARCRDQRRHPVGLQAAAE